MVKITSLTIGTRGSTLALAQTKLVVDVLRAKYPDVDIQTKIIVTKGDLNQSPIPADAVGKDWFTAEIEQALLKNEIDMAVHSMKDLPPETPEELMIVPVLKRGDPRDAFISKTGSALKDLPRGATIGTDSIRRRVLLLEQRPDLIVKSIRGNIDTRLKKLHDEPYDAIVLAAAGLERAGMISTVSEFLDPLVFIPAIGQGILAAQAHRDRPDILDMLHLIQDAPTAAAAEAEQLFSTTVGGGCKTPIGCYARIEHEVLFMDAFLQSEGETKLRRQSASGPLASAKEIAEDMGRALLQ